VDCGQYNSNYLIVIYNANVTLKAGTGRYRGIDGTPFEIGEKHFNHVREEVDSHSPSVVS
jgi:hypothetical protein